MGEKETNANLGQAPADAGGSLRQAAPLEDLGTPGPPASTDKEITKTSSNIQNN